MYTIYSYWDMAEIQSVLNAVAMVSNSADFGSLLRVFALIGLLVAVTYGFVRARGEDAAAYLIIIAIWYVGLFLPKVTVTIEDRAPATGAPVQVTNVPLGLAFFASTSSHIGAWLTETYETYFSLPDAELQFNKNGILFGSRILEEMRRSSVADPSLAQDLTSFVKNCVNPELLSDPTLMNSLVNEPDIWQFIVTGAAGGLFNPGLAVTVYDESAGSSRWVNCVDAVSGGGPLTAAESLNGRLTAAVAGEQNKLARLLNPGRTPASANALIASQIEAAETVMLTASRAAVQGIRQNMMINLMRDTSKTIPQLLNDPAAVQIATAESMAAASSNSSYLVMAKVAEGALPKIRNVIHLVVLAVFPILMLLLIMAGTKGGLVLRSYGITLLWVHLWPPLYAVVNYISTMAAAKSAVSTLGGIEGQTLATAATLASTVISDQAVAGLLTIVVPIMALALVKGGEVAMSGVVSSVMGPAQSAASRAGDSVGQGNISMGTTSWGTHTASMMSTGKADMNASYMAGQWTRGQGREITSGDQGFAGQGSRTAGNPGPTLDLSRFSQNLGDYGATAKSAADSTRTNAESTQWTDARTKGASVGEAWAAVKDAAKVWGSEASTTKKYGANGTVTDTGGTGTTSSDNGVGASEGAGSAFAVGTNQASSFDTRASVGGSAGASHQNVRTPDNKSKGSDSPGGSDSPPNNKDSFLTNLSNILRMGASIDAGAGLNTKQATTREGKNTSQLSAVNNAISQSENAQRALTAAIQYLDGIDGSDKTSGGQQLRSSLQNALKAEESYSASLSKVRSKLEQDSSSTKLEVAGSQNLGNRILQEAYNGDVEAMSAALKGLIGTSKGGDDFNANIDAVKRADPSLLSTPKTPGATGKNDDVQERADAATTRDMSDVSAEGRAAVNSGKAANDGSLPGAPNPNVNPVDVPGTIVQIHGSAEEQINAVREKGQQTYQQRINETGKAADEQNVIHPVSEAFGSRESGTETVAAKPKPQRVDETMAVGRPTNYGIGND